MSYALIIHGGAGMLKNLDKTKKLAYEKVLGDFINYGEKLLSKGAKALDVAEEVVRMLEDHPLFNAGKGSVLTYTGKVEMDAGIMCGKTLNVGAVAGVKTVKNPISLARTVLEKSEHVMLIGKGAELFARVMGIEVEDLSYFLTEERQKQWQEAQNKNKIVLDHDDIEEKYGTVGAVVRDKYGDLASATSTGGIVNKKWGRVGDSPIVGAGVYADNNTCAVSATGYGEQFIRTVFAKRVAEFIEWKGYNAQKACEEAIEYLKSRVKGLGGVIAIDYQGNLGCAFCTNAMLRAWVKKGESVNVAIYGNGLTC